MYGRRMGFLDGGDDDRAEWLVVASARGRVTLGSTVHAKGRVFVMEDRSVVLVLPGEGGRGVRRVEYVALTSEWHPASKALRVTLSDGHTLSVDASGCGCGMGAVGNAGPSEERYRLTKVRAPEWHSIV